ncbi:MAG TPA: hypothetical protein VFX22_05570, partial [Candidatus Kapabacteria bacterium]|nr:hypothetical protein [Candidatus Kapabacteria bacterium]
VAAGKKDTTYHQRHCEENSPSHPSPIKFYIVIPSEANQSETIVCVVEESSVSPRRFLDYAIISFGNYCSARNDIV